MRRPDVKARNVLCGRPVHSAHASTTAMIPSDRQIRYWKASDWSATRASTVPKLQMAPALNAINGASVTTRWAPIGLHRVVR